MSLELKDDERYLIFFYEPPKEDDYNSALSQHYTEWLKNENIGSRKRLLNVIRHPDMNKNILIHYFAVLKE